MRLKLLVLLLCLTSIAVARAQNVIINGNFDTPPFNMVGTVSGWDVTGNVADRTGQGSTSDDAAAALSAGANSEDDMLSQTFTTTIGQTYALDLDAGVFGEPTEGPLSLRIQVTGTSTLVNQTVQPPNNNNHDPAPFNHYSFQFAADSASTTLTFIDMGLGNADADVMVDTVSVVPVLEPATVMLMITGGGSLGLMWRRKRHR